MTRRPQRTRRRPGPLTVFAVALASALALEMTVVRAHDPGLSSLDVTVNGTSIVASIAISAADVAQLAAARALVAPRAVHDLVRGAVRVSVDGALLQAVNEDTALGPDGARIQVWYAATPPSLHHRRLEVTSDLPARLSRGHRELLTVTAGGRTVIERVLDATADSIAVDLIVTQPSAARHAWSFFTLGIRHILSGYDHLVFLAGVILGASTLRRLVIALTAFTVAHSLSLALVVIAGVAAPAAIVEPLIAASIAWIGIENLLCEHVRARWWLVFGFGLIHGFGFAGALMDLGLGSRMRDVTVALLSFNGGVEAGQLTVGAAMLPLLHLMRSRPAWRTRLVPVCSALIAIAGGCWLIDRLW